jgi:NSS family neurotransmitter:Na+ symporter
MLLPLGGLLVIVFAGWFMKPADVRDELSSQGLYAVKWFKAFQIAARFIAPIAIVVVLVAKISGKIS